MSKRFFPEATSNREIVHAYAMRALQMRIGHQITLRFDSGPIIWRSALMSWFCKKVGWSQGDLLKLVNTIQIILSKYERYTMGRNKYNLVLIPARPKPDSATPEFYWDKNEIRIYCSQPFAEVLAHAPYKICRELIEHTDPADENPVIMITRSSDLFAHVFQALKEGIDAVIQHYYDKRAVPLNEKASEYILSSIIKCIQDLIVKDKTIHGLFSPYPVPKQAVLKWANNELRQTVSSAAEPEFDGKTHAWSLIGYMAFLTILARNAGDRDFEIKCLEHINGDFGTNLMQIEQAQLAGMANEANSFSPLLSAQTEPAKAGYRILFSIFLETSCFMFNNMQVGKL